MYFVVKNLKTESKRNISFVIFKTMCVIKCFIYIDTFTFHTFHLIFIHSSAFRLDFKISWKRNPNDDSL